MAGFFHVIFLAFSCGCDERALQKSHHWMITKHVLVTFRLAVSFFLNSKNLVEKPSFSTDVSLQSNQVFRSASSYPTRNLGTSYHRLLGQPKSPVWIAVSVLDSEHRRNQWKEWSGHVFPRPSYAQLLYHSLAEHPLRIQETSPSISFWLTRLYHFFQGNHFSIIRRKPPASNYAWGNHLCHVPISTWTWPH